VWSATELPLQSRAEECLPSVHLISHPPALNRSAFPLHSSRPPALNRSAFPLHSSRPPAPSTMPLCPRYHPCLPLLLPSGSHPDSDPSQPSQWFHTHGAKAATDHRTEAATVHRGKAPHQTSLHPIHVCILRAVLCAWHPLISTWCGARCWDFRLASHWAASSMG